MSKSKKRHTRFVQKPTTFIIFKQRQRKLESCLAIEDGYLQNLKSLSLTPIQPRLFQSCVTVHQIETPWLFMVIKLKFGLGSVSLLLKDTFFCILYKNDYLYLCSLNNSKKP